MPLLGCLYFAQPTTGTPNPGLAKFVRVMSILDASFEIHDDRIATRLRPSFMGPGPADHRAAMLAQLGQSLQWQQ
jgi:hypothetical protein